MHYPRRRVLCTEDDPDTRDLIVLILESGGHDVTVTDNCAEALYFAKNHRFDLFLVDNWMPEITGPELTLQLREFDKTTPILFYSGAALESDKQEARDAGAQGYLVKPAGISDLVDEVARLIAEARIAFPIVIDSPRLEKRET
jgi:CheY-like chemotaxis protein